MIKSLEWKPVIIGIIIAVVFYLAGIVSGQNFMLYAFLTAGMAVGFMISTEYIEGLKYGALTGVIGAIVVLVLLLVMLVLQGAGTAIISAFMTTLLIFLVMNVILSAVGGAIGSVIKAEAAIDRTPEDLEE
jgi:hypothetical protein